MNLYRETLTEFGRTLGLPSLSPGATGGVELTIEKVGTLQMEEGEECVLVTLARPWPPHGENTSRAALTLCHWRENHPWPINPGAKGKEWLTFTARVPLIDFSVQTLDKLLGALVGLHEEVEKAG